MLDTRLEIHGAGAEWGEKLRGTLWLETVRVPAQAKFILVSLPEVPERLELDPRLFPVYQAFRRTWDLKPGPRQVRFALPMPWRPLRVRDTRVVARVEWRERAGTHGAWGGVRESLAEARVTVRPPDDLPDLLQVVGEVTDTEFSTWQDPQRGEGVCAVLAPRDRERRVFDAVTLELQERRRSGRGFRYDGFLHLDLREYTAADHIRAAVLGNSASVGVRLRSDDPEGARRHLAERLRMFLDRVRTLPLPSSAPRAGRESLPRPAMPPEGRNE